MTDRKEEQTEHQQRLTESIPATQANNGTPDLRMPDDHKVADTSYVGRYQWLEN